MTTTDTNIEIIPAALKERMAALTTEAKALRPVVDTFAEHAWRTMREYESAISPLFDRDKADAVSGYEELWYSVQKLADSLGAVNDAYGVIHSADWLKKTEAERAEAERVEVTS